MSGATSWRRTRPFWGGLLTLLAGLELLSIPFATQALPLVIQSGTVGATYLIALVLIILGLLLWLQPGQRVFLGIVAVLVSIASFVYANLGGFLIGMLLGLVGGALAAAWTPVTRTDGPRAAGASGGAPAAAGTRAAGTAITAGTSGGFRTTAISGTSDIASTARPHSPSQPPSQPRTQPRSSSSSSGGAPSVWIGRVKSSSGPSEDSTAEPPDAPDDGRSHPGGRTPAMAVLPLILMAGQVMSTAATSGVPLRDPVASSQRVAVEAAAVRAPSLTMTGMKFHGVVEMPAATGTVKMLRFTMDKAVLVEPQQTMGRTTLVGSTFTFEGDVVICTTKMTGKLLGIPQEFTADKPNVLVKALKLVPSLSVPLTMTDIESEQPYVTADSLRADGLRLTVGP
ncbi:DUF6114 domain-containing protein [Planotetraspora sp. A-T 1434]|uniref:DUF6114 domain-containing protein n=1 Tax=Planotetraspora sp. A-T 1434 TaxID=2979219 RepID=UPI0021C1A1C2|nr:DUF6114 domain-containing protein [Planotetraspora sp. A-T 1434]MCT9928837.1 DUF6114 domain-containing protein [Planotetraspora sp. A-T 1434]